MSKIMFIMVMYIIGFILGYIYARKRTECHGVIEVDHTTGLCKVRVKHDSLADRKVKKATFVVDHDASISQDNQGL